MKVLISFFLIFFSVLAHAEWTYISSGSGGDVSFYDKSRVRVFAERKVVQGWTMVNLGKPELDKPTGKTYSSTIAKEQYFCLEEKSAILNLIAYTKKDGGGGVVFNEEIQEPRKRTIVPGTVGETMFNVFCKNL